MRPGTMSFKIRMLKDSGFQRSSRSRFSRRIKNYAIIPASERKIRNYGFEKTKIMLSFIVWDWFVRVAVNGVRVAARHYCSKAFNGLTNKAAGMGQNRGEMVTGLPVPSWTCVKASNSPAARVLVPSRSPSSLRSSRPTARRRSSTTFYLQLRPIPRPPPTHLPTYLPLPTATIVSSGLWLTITGSRYTRMQSVSYARALSRGTTSKKEEEIGPGQCSFSFFTRRVRKVRVCGLPWNLEIRLPSVDSAKGSYSKVTLSFARSVFCIQ